MSEKKKPETKRNLSFQPKDRVRTEFGDYGIVCFAGWSGAGELFYVRTQFKSEWFTPDLLQKVSDEEIKAKRERSEWKAVTYSYTPEKMKNDLATIAKHSAKKEATKGKK